MERQKERCEWRDNLPTVPQGKRVVPLLIVWSSRCGGWAKRGADSQGGTNKPKSGTKWLLSRYNQMRKSILIMHV